MIASLLQSLETARGHPKAESLTLSEPQAVGAGRLSRCALFSDSVPRLGSNSSYFDRDFGCIPSPSCTSIESKHPGHALLWHFFCLLPEGEIQAAARLCSLRCSCWL